MRDPDGGWIGFDARPAAVKTFAAYTLKRLGVDHIDIYRPARLDPNVPIEDTIGAIADLVKAGYVRHIGLSEVGAETIRRAAAVHPIADLQIEYSLISRGIEDEILPTSRELGIGITAYGVLSRGLISGHWGKDRAGERTSGAHARASRARTSTATWLWSRRCAKVATAQGRHSRPDRDRLGRRARQGHRAAGWRAAPRPAGRSARRADVKLDAADLPRSSRRCRRAPRPASATPRRRWQCSTAREAETSLGRTFRNGTESAFASPLTR